MQITDILYYSKEKGKRIKLHDCELISDFKFAKQDFYVVYKKGYFFVCLPVKGDLISLWHQKKKDNGEVYSFGEVTSLFRKKYLKNNITQDKLDAFIENPIEYERKYKASE